jgi:hypothetical protein
LKIRQFSQQQQQLITTAAQGMIRPVYKVVSGSWLGGRVLLVSLVRLRLVDVALVVITGSR